MIIIYVIISYALGCQVYYNKDLLFDFSTLKGIDIQYGEEGKSLYINTCSLLNYQCVKNTRLLADVVDQNVTTNSTNNTTIDTNTTINTNQTINNNQTIDTNQTINSNTTNSTIDNNNNTTNTQIDTNTTINTNNTNNTSTNIDTNTTIDKNNTINTKDDDDDDDDNKYILKEDEQNQLQSIIIKTKDQCKPLSEQSGVDKEQVTLVGERDVFKGIFLKRRGIIEKDEITLKLICKYDATTVQIISFDDDFQFILGTSSACPILLQNPMIGFFDTFKWMFSIILWVVGIFLLGFGYQLAQLSSIIMAAIMGFGFTTIVIGEAALDYDSSGAALSIVVGAGIIVGFIYLNASVTRFFFLLFNFGFSVGVVISLIIQSIFFYLIDTDMMYFPLGTSIIVLGIILGLLGLRFNLQMGIISTSLVGAYCFIRPWGFILGGYPNELLLTKQIEYGFPINQSKTVYIYNVLIIIVAIGCAIYQRKQHLKRVAFDDQLSNDIKYYEMGKVQEEKERQSKGSDNNVTVHFAKHLDNEPVQRYSHITGSDKND